ncbi:hypothetical protein H257_10975 [Aphanomyces astaci]|uniref:Transposase Tc1-like domain-containing protein n=1 Tax=Aphanomyces astaci TaxID=112090 RepID=W4G5Q2_APHAT|nr:hypothetical protein H257_10975 [Aphanomyces astaci]ETV74384.1 hypothetical protein H257_10975 [Aphanomyces astaci]|eukprot:XP_009836042.1 hypothetical protein H257_10975 [Aphanomyces astaci]
MPPTTLHGYYKRVLVRHSSYVKPLLTDANKAARLKWANGFQDNARPQVLASDNVLMAACSWYANLPIHLI